MTEAKEVQIEEVDLLRLDNCFLAVNNAQLQAQAAQLQANSILAGIWDSYTEKGVTRKTHILDQNKKMFVPSKPKAGPKLVEDSKAPKK